MSCGSICQLEMQLCPLIIHNLEQIENNHNISEKCKSKLQWGTNSRRSEWVLSKSLQTVNAGEGAEKRELSCTAGRNLNWYSHYGEEYADFFKNQE